MSYVCDAAYVLTFPGTGISATTRTSLGDLVVREATLPPVEDRPFAALAQRARAEGVGRLLLLVDGEEVDTQSLATACRAGDPGPPGLVRRPSVADDALELPVPRLLSPTSLERLEWRIDDHDVDAGPSARWSIHQPPLHARRSRAVVGWARCQARAITVRQLQRDLEPQEDVLLARLLLLAAEHDAVVVRAARGLSRRRSGHDAVAWARLGVAGAMAAGRVDAAVAPLRRWSEEVAGTAAAHLAEQWSVITADALGLFSEAVSRWDSLALGTGEAAGAVDPWLLVHRRALAERAAQAADASLEIIGARPAITQDEQRSTMVWWRRAGRDAGEMVRGWPSGQLDLLVSALVPGLRTDPRWWLEVAEALHVRSPLSDALLREVAVRAAAFDTESALRWAVVTRSRSYAVPSPLDLRAADASLPGLERLAAAVVRYGEVGERRRNLVLDAAAAVEPHERDDAVGLVAALEPRAMDLVAPALGGGVVEREQPVTSLRRGP